MYHHPQKQSDHRVCACLLSRFRPVWLCDPKVTFQTPLSMDSPAKNIGMGCHAIFGGILPIQGSNPHLLLLLYWQMIFFFFFFLPLGPPGMSKYRISDLSAVTQSWLTLCHPMDCSPPGSFLHGFLKVRILEWVAITFSRGFSNPRDQTWVSCIAGRFFTVWATGIQNNPTQMRFFKTF